MAEPEYELFAIRYATREARREQRNCFEVSRAQPRARGDARRQATSAVGAALLGHGVWKGQSA